MTFIAGSISPNMVLNLNLSKSGATLNNLQGLNATSYAYAGRLSSESLEFPLSAYMVIQN